MVTSVMTGLAGLIAQMPDRSVDASAHDILEVADKALVYLGGFHTQDVQLNVNHAAGLQVACYDALAAVGSKVCKTMWAGAHQTRLQSYQMPHRTLLLSAPRCLRVP
jgi:hypothetical protein